METGNLIYRQKKNKMIYLFLGIFLAIGLYGFVQSLLEGEVNLAFGLFILVPSLLMFLIYRSDQEIPSFYEHGILLYKKNQPTDFVPYHQVETIECFFRRTQNEDGSSRNNYGITFCVDGYDIAQLEFSTLRALLSIWNPIVACHPELKEAIVERDHTPGTAKLYRELMGYRSNGGFEDRPFM